MSLIDVKSALKVPGRLCYGPSLNFATAFPHGGTALGMILAATVRHSETLAPVRIEEYGVTTEIADLVEAGERWVFTCALRGNDADALSVVFRNTIAGATSGQRLIQHPGARGEGPLRSVSRSISLLFSPIDPQHPAVYFPQALPMLEGDRELVLHRKTERVILAGFVATRASTTAGSAVQVGLLEDLNAAANVATATLVRDYYPHVSETVDQVTGGTYTPLAGYAPSFAVDGTTSKNYLTGGGTEIDLAGVGLPPNGLSVYVLIACLTATPDISGMAAALEALSGSGGSQCAIGANATYAKGRLRVDPTEYQVTGSTDAVPVGATATKSVLSLHVSESGGVVSYEQRVDGVVDGTVSPVGTMNDITRLVVGGRMTGTVLLEAWPNQLYRAQVYNSATYDSSVVTDLLALLP